MTTVCVTTTALATDATQYADDVRITTNGNKIFIPTGHPDRIFAIAGTSSMLEPAALWVLAGAKPEDVPKYGDWTLVDITLHKSRTPKVVWWTQNVPFAHQAELPFAMGSGERYAYGALDSGMTAEDAVKAAAKRDPYTGGDVRVVRFASVLARMYQHDDG